MIPFNDALQRIQETISIRSTETVDLQLAVGRVLAAPIFADVDSPPHRKSVMDGYAVRSSDINERRTRLRVTETIVAGGWPTKTVLEGEAARIMTGAPIPDGADAVVMVEKTIFGQDGDENFVVIELDHLNPGQHLIDQGDVFSRGQVLLPAGHCIRAFEIGLLAEAGSDRISVVSRPTVAILPTGNELIDYTQVPDRSQIRNSNGPMLWAMVRQAGLSATLLPACRDDEDELQQQIEIGLKHDLLLITGGVSEGILDLIPRTLERLGVKQVFHRVNMKPGKPIWFGVRGSSDSDSSGANHDADRPTNGQEVSYVFGLPGNPVSSLVGFHLFVQAAMRCMEGRDPKPGFVDARLSQDHEVRGNRDSFWPGRLVESQDAIRWVEPLSWRGSSDSLSITRSDGLIYLPGSTGGAAAGTQVRFYSWSW